LTLTGCPQECRRLRAEIEWIYQSDYYINDANSSKAGAYSVINLRAMQDVAPGVSAGLRILNAANRKYALAIEDFGFGAGYRPAPPRTVDAFLTWSW
jgi:outer membrane receptor protein involved in Fe transport